MGDHYLTGAELGSEEIRAFSRNGEALEALSPPIPSVDFPGFWRPPLPPGDIAEAAGKVVFVIRGSCS